MPTVKGRANLTRHFAKLPEDIRRKLLRPAAKAGAEVIAVEAKLRAPSVVAKGVVVRTKATGGTIRAKVTVEDGWARSVGIWAEYGTEGHYISVKDEARDGKSVRRINELDREGSLRIGDNFVGASVWHPGAQAHPFLRPAFDFKLDDAIATAQSVLNARVTAGIVGTADQDDAA